MGGRLERQAIIWLPNRSARLAGISYANRTLHVEAEIGTVAYRQLLRVKAAWRCGSNQSSWVQFEEEVSEGIHTIPIPVYGVPDEFWVTVSDRDHPLDRRGWDTNSPARPTDTDSLAAELEA